MTFHRSLFPGVLMAAAMAFTGCQRGSAPPADSTAAGSATAAAEPAAEQTVATTPQDSPRRVDPDRKETKWIGEIPYDVFYDQPLTIAADTTSVGESEEKRIATSSSTTPDPGSAVGSAQSPPASENPSASADGGEEGADWGEVLPMDFLVEEVKSLRTRLTANLQTVATFNQNTDRISVDGAILAAMAAIATVHPEQTSWKENARFVRDLGYEIYLNSLGGASGRTPFMQCKEPFERIMTVLDGGPPPDDLDSDPVVDFADLIYAAEMMKRIESTFNSLKSDINTEARMKEDPLAVEREMRLLAALMTLMGHDGYGSAEEEQYQTFVEEFVSASLEGAQAVKLGNFAGYQSAVNTIQTSCSECHRQYRSGEAAF